MTDDNVIKLRTRQSKQRRARLNRMRAQAERIAAQHANADMREAVIALAQLLTHPSERDPVIIRAAEAIIRSVALDLKIRLAAPRLAKIEAAAPATG